jgi:hypothetical protein
MGPKLIAGVVLWIVLLGLLIFYRPAQAETFRGNDIVCTHLSNTAYDVAQMRDAGVPWEQFSTFISTQLKVALGVPESYIKDADDVHFVYESFKRIYDEPALTPDEAVGKTKQACMIVKQKLRV